MHNLKPKLGSLGVMFHQSSGIASFYHHQESQSGLIKNLGAGSCNRPTLFTIWRSEHFKAEKQLDCKQNCGGPQVFTAVLYTTFELITNHYLRYSLT